MYYILIFVLILLLVICYGIIYYCNRKIKIKADNLIAEYMTYKNRIKNNIKGHPIKQNHTNFRKKYHHQFFQFLKNEPGLSFAEKFFLVKQFFMEELLIMRFLSIAGIPLSLAAVLVTFFLFPSLRFPLINLTKSQIISLVPVSSGCFVVILFYILGSIYWLIKAKNFVLYTIYNFEEVDKKQDEAARSNKHKSSAKSIKQKKEQELEINIQGEETIELDDYEIGANSSTPGKNSEKQKNLLRPIKVKLSASGVFEQDNDGHFILYLEPGEDSGSVYPGDEIRGSAIEPAMEKKFSSAFDFFFADIGHYEMVTPAKISWAAHKKRGEVKEKGQIRK